MGFLGIRKIKLEIFFGSEPERHSQREEEIEMQTLYDRIIAGVLALQSGDTAALSEHVDAIDSHLTDVDAAVLGIKDGETSDEARITAIETGLGQIADAVGPVQAPAGDGSGTVANPGGGSDSGAVSGSGSDAGNPGGTSDAGAGSGSGVDAGNPGGADTGNGAGAVSDGSQSADNTPDGGSGSIPASGPGSETTGQVDTPVTSQ